MYLTGSRICQAQKIISSHNIAQNRKKQYSTFYCQLSISENCVKIQAD
nr:MAG TPA: hypothetical protein [Caudoviricetes sp.]